MNLLNLAPDIQEAILFLPRVESGRDPVGERELRRVAAKAEWGKQRRKWKCVRSPPSGLKQPQLPVQPRQLEKTVFLLTTSTAIEGQLRRLIWSSEQISLAVAWASRNTECCNLLFRNQEKIKLAIVGTHFYQTDPDFIADFREHPRLRFQLATHEVFHPKCYLFEGNDEWTAIVGSATSQMEDWAPMSRLPFWSPIRMWGLLNSGTSCWRSLRLASLKPVTSPKTN